MASEYQQTTDAEIHDRVISKYRASLDELKALNFQELCCFGETVRALGLSIGPFGPLGVIAALPKEVTRVGLDLSVSVFLLLLVSREYDTYVAPFGLGVKFFTSFSDGTFIITTNYGSDPIHDDGEKLYKSLQPGPIEAAWNHHQAWVNNLTARGKQRQYHLSFDHFAKLAQQEDQYMLKSESVGKAWMITATIFLLCLFSAILPLFLH